MSMLTPAELSVFLTSIGYTMTDAERTRFMRFDRFIFKDTTALEKLMREGYKVVLVSPRLHRLRDLVKYKGGSKLPPATLPFSDRTPFVHDPEDEKFAHVWLIITHKKHLGKDDLSRTVVRHPEFRWKGWDDGPGKPGEGYPGDFAYPRGFNYEGIAGEGVKIFDLHDWRPSAGKGPERKIRTCESGCVNSDWDFLQDTQRGDYRMFYLTLNEPSLVIHQLEPIEGSEDPDEDFYATMGYDSEELEDIVISHELFYKIPIQ